MTKKRKNEAGFYKTKEGYHDELTKNSKKVLSLKCRKTQK